MNARLGVTAALAFLAYTAPSVGQVQGSRSGDYLFATNVADVRALWVNPAGLAVLPLASVMAEFAIERTMDGDYRMGQYSLGLNSRGFGLGYQRDRFPGVSTGVLRVGTGLPFPGGAVGFAASWYQVPGSDSRDVDIGIMYGVGGSLTLAGVLRHIGRPTVGGVTELPLTLVGGAQVTGLAGRLQVSGEATGMERRGPGESGWEMSYRGGLMVVFPAVRPISAIGTVDLSSSLALQRFHVGLAIGGLSRVVGVATAIKEGSDVRFDRMSISGVATSPIQN